MPKYGNVVEKVVSGNHKTNEKFEEMFKSFHIIYLFGHNFLNT